MNLSLFGYGITLSGHFYRHGYSHVCDAKDCPARIPPAEIKYVIVRRSAGAYSERFDTREDAERALRLFQPGARALKDYEVLESVRIFGEWMIGDPALPADHIFFVSRTL